MTHKITDPSSRLTIFVNNTPIFGASIKKEIKTSEDLQDVLVEILKMMNAPTVPLKEKGCEPSPEAVLLANEIFNDIG